MATITYLTRIEFDHGAVASLNTIATELGIKAPMIRVATDTRIRVLFIGVLLSSSLSPNACPQW